MLQKKEILDAALQLPDKECELLVDELAASLHSSRQLPTDGNHPHPAMQIALGIMPDLHFTQFGMKSS
jgi:hypothetical protein